MTEGRKPKKYNTPGHIGNCLRLVEESQNI
jgi:hypothetical protein